MDETLNGVWYCCRFVGVMDSLITQTFIYEINDNRYFMQHIRASPLVGNTSQLVNNTSQLADRMQKHL